MTLPGIDLSDFQSLSSEDWSTLASQGLKFAFVKATEGRSFRAESFQEKWRDAKAAGLLRGAYHFFRPSRTGEEQAANFLEALQAVGGLEQDDLSPVLDIESRDGIQSSEIRKRCLVWLDQVEQATGRTPIIYTGPSFGEDVLGPDARFAAYPLWVAHYTKGQPSIPKKWANCALWQYMETGRVKGIVGGVDLNWFNGDENALKAFACGDCGQIIPHSLFSDLIHFGDEGEAVTAIQRKLIALGYSLGSLGADGDFGSFTESAVKSFQQKNNLPINGIVDPATYNKLSALA